MRVFACLPLALAFACTEPAQREQLRIEIEADRAVQALVDEVSVVVEYSNPNGGWQPLDTQRFEPKVRNPFPIEYRIPALDRKVAYQLTATAFDERSSIVARARAVHDADATGRLLLRVIFETECVRLGEVCANGQTCHDGECVDARLDTTKLRPSDEPAVDGGLTEDAGPDPGGPTLAAEDEECSPEGARACFGENSRFPLRCEEGVWKPEQECAETELCDTTRGSQRGTCRAIAPECLGKLPNQEFCDRDAMRVCTNMFEVSPRECGDNRQCVAPNGVARCECRPGFVDPRDGSGCREPTSCAQNNGGCDRLTQCTMKGAARVCGACPAGYLGEGDTGCEPLLSGLGVSVGQLAPAFRADVHAYRLRVPLLAQRVTLTPSANADARIELNGTSIPPGEGWPTPTLLLGENPVTLTLTAASGVTSTYQLVIEREGSQHAYLKASNADELDGLGMMVAMSGDTLVAGAPYEDSAAARVDGDQSDNSMDDSGAAYVFSKRGDSWEQEAYLKPTDPMAGGRFGTSVAIAGDTIVVGAIHSDLLGSSSARAGVAYVFTRAQGKWSQTARLSPPLGSPGDMFGFNVAIQGDSLVVSAVRDGGSGAAYVYTRTAGAWDEQQKLKPMQPASGAAFGSSVAIWGDTLIVGSSEDGRDMDSAGSAYVFQRDGGVWTQTQRLTADPIDADANFGYSMAMTEDRLLIGAPRVASIGSIATTDPGEVFAFKRNGATWQLTQRLRAVLPRASDSFGSAVALSAAAALVGSCGDASGASGVGAAASRRDAPYAGAGHLFALEGEDWKASAYLKAQVPNSLDSLGFAVTLGENVAVLSANWESSSARGINGDQRNNSARNAGAVYVFE